MKRLIVCCDGTWSRPEQNWFGASSPTNVVRLAARIAKHDEACPQIVWYDQGLGTGNFVDAISGGLLGSGLDDNIIEAYRFLVANYVPGDELFLFGFSRGAYTVRSLAGMIRKCGIVRRDRLRSYAPALALYRDAQHPDERNGPKKFRAEFSIAGSEPIPIKFIGVWDTVGALGIPLSPLSSLTQKRYEFHDTELSGTVEYAYQALAVDERRKPFSPTLWKSVPKKGQTLEQVWFSGTHSDVGGGVASRGLPDIALHWMMNKARGAGLAFDPAVTAAYPLEQDSFATLNIIERARIWSLLADRLIGLKEREDALDATQSLHPAVIERWDSVPSYRPRNLSAYFGRGRDPRASMERPSSPGWLSKLRT